MDGFQLSPGITPFLTDIFVLIFPLAVVGGFVLGRGPGLALGFGVVAIALAVVKLWTDYFDPGDDVVAIVGLVGGLLVALTANGWRPKIGRAGRVAIFVVFFGTGVIKARFDFYDPFDLLLAVIDALAGGWVLFRTTGRSLMRPPPAPVPPA